MFQALRHWPVFPFLFPVFFVVRALRRYHAFLQPDDILRTLGPYLIFTALFFLLARLVFKDSYRAAMLTLLVLGIQFFWSSLTAQTARFVQPFSPAHDALSLGVALFCIVAGFVLLGRLRHDARLRLTHFLNWLFIAYIFVEGALAVYHHSSHRPERLPNALVSARPAIATENRPPDVFCIVFDEYASSSSLMHNMRYDNSATDSFLARRGFSVQSNSRSNYNMTVFSIASLLNGSFVPLPENLHKIRVADFNTSINFIRSSRVIDSFASRGYEIRNYSLFNLPGAPVPDYGRILMLPIATRLITANTFSEMIFKKYHLMRGGRGWRLYNNAGHYSAYRYNESVAADVLDHIRQPGEKPQFVYAHFLSPHAPFNTGPDGKPAHPDSTAHMSLRNNPIYYIYNLRYANSKLRSITDSILKYRPGQAIVLFLGDHGQRDMVYATDTAHYFSNLNAVYQPGGAPLPGLYDSVSNVNMMRLVMNRALGTAYPLLPDSTFFLKQVPD